MTYQIRLPSELTDAELVESIHYWEGNRDLVSAEPILAIHIDEQRRRLAASLERRGYTGTCWPYGRREVGTLSAVSRASTMRT